MTTLFVAKGLLERRGDVLHVTPLAREHLVSWSPWFLGPYFPKVTDRHVAIDLLEVLRTGRPANFNSRKDTADWHKAMESEAFAEEFTAAMDRRGQLLAQALARRIDLGPRRRLLDIAGGSGIYACGLAAHFPDLRGAVLEKPPVDRIAARAIAARGFDDRLAVVAGDMLAEPLPAGYDIHLLSNVLHDWDDASAALILHRCRAALLPGGALLIVESLLADDGSGPSHAAAISLAMLLRNPGRNRSLAEFRAMLEAAGFRDVEARGLCSQDLVVARA